MQKPRCNWGSACATSRHPADQGCSRFQPIGGAVTAQSRTEGAPPWASSKPIPLFLLFLQEIISDKGLFTRRNPQFLPA